ncbi:MAG: type III-A CRISPR-associated protein Csm2 [Nitrospirae bacterium]|nr:MAG: type III-A CRISPR-associated protein Csm2 [Nitrospirota bacterium]
MTEQSAPQSATGSRPSPSAARSPDRERAQSQADRLRWARDLGEKLKDIETLSATTIVEIARRAGERLRFGGLKMNQIRRFLTELREIESMLKHNPEEINLQDRVILLRPKLAYAAGRQREVRPFMEILDPAIKGVSTRKGFDNLLHVVESIVAYHRYYGGE